MTAPILHDAPVPITAPDSRAALLRLLSDGEEHTHAEMTAAGGARFGARLHELRRAGHNIETLPVDASRGRYRYRLLPGPLAPTQVRERQKRQDIYERACDALAHLGDFRRAPWSVQAQPSLEVAIKQLRAIVQAVQS